MDGWKPLVLVVSIPSNVGGEPPMRPTLPTIGTVTSNRKTYDVGKSIVYVPPTNTDVLNPPSSPGHPWWCNLHFINPHGVMVIQEIKFL